MSSLRAGDPSTWRVGAHRGSSEGALGRRVRFGGTRGLMSRCVPPPMLAIRPPVRAPASSAPASAISLTESFWLSLDTDTIAL